MNVKEAAQLRNALVHYQQAQLANYQQPIVANIVRKFGNAKRRYAQLLIEKRQKKGS